MSRRQGAEGFESNKKARKQAKIAQRTQDTQDERSMLLIACEDSVSTPLYFRAIFNDLKNNHAIAASSLVIAKHKHTDPDGILDDLLNHPNYKDFDHQWIVIDRDAERTNGGGHTIENFNQAIVRAKDKNIKVAYSNPCFEIWYLLHFEYRNTAIDRDELVKQLKRNYRYKKNKLFSLNQDQQNTAIKNATNLIQSWIDTPQCTTKPATDNPSTAVHDLVKLLNGFKKDPAPQPEQVCLSCNRNGSLWSPPLFFNDFSTTGVKMVTLETPICDFGQKAIDFELPGVDGRTWTLQQCMGKNGLLVMFICNHCPYVRAVQERIVRDARELKALGVESVAIMPNDTIEYPADSFDNMKLLSEQLGFSFPYLLDETQQIAKAYGAICTPDFFGYNADYELQYRGRLDASRKETAPPDTRRELFEAMKLIAETGHGPKEQINSIGCSIKWKQD